MVGATSKDARVLITILMNDTYSLMTRAMMI